MAKSSDSSNPFPVPDHKFLWGVNQALWRYISNPKLVRFDQPKYKELMAESFYCNSKDRTIRLFFREFYEKIETLKRNGTILVIRKFAIVPNRFATRARERIQGEAENSDWARRASLILQYLLAPSDIRRLPESFGRAPKHLSHVVGEESSDYRLSRFKLPDNAATLYPNKPFGPSIFGDKGGLNLDSPCPDILAFIVMDLNDDVRSAGPLVYTLEDLEREIDIEDPSMLSSLRDTNYVINPDKALTRNFNQPNGFGGISDINVFGERGTSGQKYMRFDLDHLAHQIQGNEAGPVGCLKVGVDRLKDKQNRIGINVDRGDVILINNRNCATEWKRQVQRRKWGIWGDGKLKSHDRTILRASFYISEPLFQDA